MNDYIFLFLKYLIEIVGLLFIQERIVREDFCKKISAIITSEKKLERVISTLIIKSVDRHAISIQGSPTKISQVFGTPYIGPTTIQASEEAPTKEYFLEDDFGWVVGFSFSIPVFVCMVIGIFVIGDIRSIYDNVVYGALGAVIGTLIGTGLAFLVRKHQLRRIQEQESRGGYVLWITILSPEQEKEVTHILKRYKACEIKCSRA